MSRMLTQSSTPPPTDLALRGSILHNLAYPRPQHRSSSGLLQASYHFSNVRSKIAQDAVRPLQEAASMTADVKIHPSLCADCLSGCNETACTLASPTEECTDQCVVVPCSDPNHSENVCVEACVAVPCEMQPCDGVVECAGSFEKLLECCTDYHSYYEDGSSDLPSSQATWDNSFDALLTTSNPHSSSSAGASSHHFGHQSRAGRSSHTQAALSNPAPTATEQAAFNAYFQTYPPPPNPMHSHPRQAPSLPSQQYQHSHQGGAWYPPGYANAIPTPTRQRELACLWSNCRATFHSMGELVGHVNLTHLRLPSGPNQGQGPFGSDMPAGPLSCMWDDCQNFPTPAAIAGPSSSNHLDAALGVLSTHLMQDHLGLSIARYPNTPTHTPAHHAHVYASPSAQRPSYAHDERDIPTPPSESSSSVSPAPPPHDCAASHVCHWEGCGKTFSLCDELTTHISALHVGAGQSQYHCHWIGCNRHGEQGFSSKQKILRHLQSHTGHRPFQCNICNQNFSEAATLQQHMRRHTQEKPYVCDFPGCNKAFAITGALTIHKRTHNGEKPFKCTHCGRAFAESSNLSKHLRTHTGARPYACTESGCEKAFARPDQLARHANVHEKKRKTENNAMQMDDD